MMKSSAELIEEKYKQDGDGVVETYQKLDFSKHLELMRKHMEFRSGIKVLDVGCGTGALLVELLRAGADVTGIDTFEEAGGIDRLIAEARLREGGFTADLLWGSAADLPFEDCTFSLAVSIGMLEHIHPADRSATLREMFRVVRQGGYLFLIAGPTNTTPLDQHIPGHPFSNWLSRNHKFRISESAGRRQFLSVPWGVSRRELREALPDAQFRSLYGAYFAEGGGKSSGGFSPSPFATLVWIKRKFGLHRVFGYAASMLYLLHQEHCHILAIRKAIVKTETSALAR